MQPLRLRSYLGYMSGDMANNLAFSMQGFFLLLYYTVVVGLNPAVIGTMFLVARLFDAVTDLLAGRLVDMTSSRWGKFRPYILFVSLPLLLTSVALFSVPALSQDAQYVYAWVTYLLLGLLYTLVNIPYGSLATAMTQDSAERSRLGSFRILGASLTILVIVAVISPQISNLADDPAQLQQFFTLATGAFVVVGMSLYLFTFWACREQVQRAVPKVTLGETLATFRTNKALAVLCGSSLVALLGVFSVQTALAFYAAYVLGDSSVMVWLIALQTGATLLVVALVPRVVSRLGKKMTFLGSTVVSAVAGVGIFFAPDNLGVILVLFALFGFSSGAINALMFALEADTVEYGEWKTDRRTEGATYAAFSFTRKVAQALSGALVGWALAFGGFDSSLPEQSDSTITAIKAVMGLSPALFALAGGVILYLAWPMTEQKFQTMLAEIRARRVETEPQSS